MAEAEGRAPAGIVVGGWTEPRNTREHIGAILLGYFEGDRFIYVGHTGGGFKLRQPTFLGVRDDKPARDVRREPDSVQDRKR